MVWGGGGEWLISIGNGAEIRPLEKGRKSSVCPMSTIFLLSTIATNLTSLLLRTVSTNKNVLA